MRVAVSAVGAMALLCACASSVVGGPPMRLPAELAQGARIDVISMDSDWLRTNEDFSGTFTDEIREELDLCATGPRRLNMSVRVEDLRLGNRAQGVLNGRSEHHLSGVVEFVEPETRAIVGRYHLSVAAGTESGIEALVADRQMVVSEAFGRELCLQAFGRNPRGHPLTRSTGG